MPIEPEIEQAEGQTPDTLSPNDQREGSSSQDTQDQGGSDTAGQQQPQQTSQNWNPQEWALNFKGQTILPKDRTHLVNLAQKGYGYETAMEQINQERQRIAQQQGQYQRYTQLDEALKSNPEFAQKLWNFVQQQQQPGQKPADQEGELPPQVLQLQSELEEIKSWKQQQAEQAASQAIDRELQEIAQAYPQYDWRGDDGTGSLAWKIMKHAYDNNLPSMKTAFRDMMFDNAASQVKLDTLKKAKETQQAQHRQGVVQTGGASAGVSTAKKTPYSPNDSYADLASKAIQALGG